MDKFLKNISENNYWQTDGIDIFKHYAENMKKKGYSTDEIINMFSDIIDVMKKVKF